MRFIKAVYRRDLSSSRLTFLGTGLHVRRSQSVCIPRQHSVWRATDCRASPAFAERKRKRAKEKEMDYWDVCLVRAQRRTWSHSWRSRLTHWLLMNESVTSSSLTRAVITFANAAKVGLGLPSNEAKLSGESSAEKMQLSSIRDSILPSVCSVCVSFASFASFCATNGSMALLFHTLMNRLMRSPSTISCRLLTKTKRNKFQSIAPSFFNFRQLIVSLHVPSSISNWRVIMPTVLYIETGSRCSPMHANISSIILTTASPRICSGRIDPMCKWFCNSSNSIHGLFFVKSMMNSVSLGGCWEIEFFCTFSTSLWMSLENISAKTSGRSRASRKCERILCNNRT